MNRFLASLFRRKPNRRRTRDPRRLLTMEALENRQLLTVATLSPVQDNSLIAYNSSANPPYSGGADPDLYLGIEHNSGTAMRALMQFDVAGNIPAGATINSVALTAWVALTYPGTPGTLNVQLHKTLAAWGEGTSTGTGRMPGIPWSRATTGDATWLQTSYNSNTALNRWASPGGDFSPATSGVTGFGADGTSATWASNAQLVADVQGWLNNPTTNFGWLLKSDEIQDIGIYIASSEASTVAHRPTLTIDYTVAAPAPTLTIAATDANKQEGNAGNTPFTFTVTRSGDTSGVTTVNYAVAGSGTNQANAADFAGNALPNGSLTFNAGETTKVITVNVNGDTAVELDETFAVTLSNAVGGSITTASATGTILNDDTAPVAPTLAVAATDASKPEGHAGGTPFTFTVTRSGDTSGVTTVNYAVAGSGTNQANAADFAGNALPNGSLTFNAGETAKVITVNVNGDTTVEPDETFAVTLSNAVGGSITTASATGTILNDDTVPVAPTLAIAATDASKQEGNASSTPFTFTVTRSGDTSGVTTVSYAVAGSGANQANAADFAGNTLPSGSVTFNASETTKVVTVNVNGDTTVEPDETFAVTLSNAVGGSITTASATGTILNDDSPPAAPTLAIAATDASKPEGHAGGTPFTFTVTRSGDTSGVTTVNYAVAGSGANQANAADFAGNALPNGSLTFNAGETTKVITVNVNGDTAVEPDETFAVTLSNAVGGSITTASATGTILNDDTAPVAPTLAIAATGAYRPEGNSGSAPFTFTVTRAGDTSGVTAVNYAVAGSGTNQANAADFAGSTLPSGSLTFNAGETTKVVTVNVNGDTAVESNETFAVTLSNAVGGNITTAAATGTILNDDTASAAPILMIVATAAFKLEGNLGSTPFTFTVMRIGDTSGATTVDYAVAGSGTNQANAADFVGSTLPSGSLTFNPSETTKVLTVNVNGDTTVEPLEMFTVTLSNAVGGRIISASATGIVLNDDTAPAAPTLAIAAMDANKPEGNSGSTPFTFTVTRTGNISGVTTVNYAVAGSGLNQANAADFVGNTLPSGTVTFNAYETTKVIAVNVNGDTAVEPDETFNVTLSAAVGGSITTAAATGTIRNDDTAPAAPTLAIAAMDANKPEGNSGSTPFTFTVTRSGNTSGVTTVNYAIAGSGLNQAQAADFVGNTLPSGTVTFNAYETTKVITVNVNGDTAVEPDETFSVTLSTAVGGSITTAAATGTIRNDDTGSVGVWLQNGVLTISGTERDDRVSVWSLPGGILLVNANFISPATVPRFRAADVQRIEVRLYGGGDSADIDRTIQIPVVMDGGAGNDVLRGGGRRTILWGGDGSDQLFGGSGATVLVGGSGDDQLTAGAGRSVLIGGDGKDSLSGSSSDDILIGGRTVYDANETALLAILAEWNSSPPFATRIDNLTAGVGPSQAYRLELGDTVLDDRAHDSLSGKSGSDWFLAFEEDKAADSGKLDRLTSFTHGHEGEDD